MQDTWLKSIKVGNYEFWPGLTYQNITNDYPLYIETVEGHMVQTWQGVLSTKIRPNNQRCGFPSHSPFCVKICVSTLKMHLQQKLWLNRSHQKRHLNPMNYLSVYITWKIVHIWYRSIPCQCVQWKPIHHDFLPLPIQHHPSGAVSITQGHTWPHWLNLHYATPKVQGPTCWSTDPWQ